MTAAKKAFFVVLALALCTVCAFAQVYDEETGEYIDLSVGIPDYSKVEVIEEKQAGLVTIRIEYWPSVDEARFYYSKPSSLFDTGDAYAAVVQRIMKFQLEHSYFSYTYMSRDELSFDKNQTPERTIYSAYVKFER